MIKQNVVTKSEEKLPNNDIGSTSMVAHKGQAVFVNDSYFKSEFHFHVQFEFKNKFKTEL